MKFSEDIVRQLQDEGYYKKYYDIFMIDKPNEKEVLFLKQRLRFFNKKLILSDNSLIVFGRSVIDIPVGASFDILFSKTNPHEFLEVRANLIYVNIHPNHETNIMLAGYTGVICIIEFENDIPDILQMLKPYMGNINKEKRESFYLSQRPLLNRILEIQKK